MRVIPTFVLATKAMTIGTFWYFVVLYLTDALMRLFIDPDDSFCDSFVRYLRLAKLDEDLGHLVLWCSFGPDNSYDTYRALQCCDRFNIQSRQLLSKNIMRFLLVAIPVLDWNIIDTDCIYGNFGADEFLKPMKPFLVLGESATFFFG